MRFLHTADWHLGRIFYNTHLTDDQAYILEELIALVKEARLDAVVVAGDVYDRSVPPPEAVKLLDDTLSRILLDCQVPVLMIAGNHDSPERLGFGDRVLARQQLYVAGEVGAVSRPVVIEDSFGPVYFQLLPYAEPAVVRDRLAVEAHSHEQAMQALTGLAGAAVPPGARRVGVAHAFVTGGAVSESERPLAVGGVPTVAAGVFDGFDYVALGHLHQPQSLGGSAVRYAGSLLKYSFAEASHHKSVSVVELDAAGAVSVEAVALTPRREVRCISGYLADILAAGERDGAAGDYIAVSLKDDGAILDAIGKLRKVYPNVMHVERTEFGAEGWTGERTDHRRQSEAELFAAFFAQTTGQSLGEEEQRTLAALLNSLAVKEREAGV